MGPFTSLQPRHVHCFQNYRDTRTLSGVARSLGAKVLSRTNDANLEYVFIENKLVFINLKKRDPIAPLSYPLDSY